MAEAASLAEAAAAELVWMAVGGAVGEAADFFRSRDKFMAAADERFIRGESGLAAAVYSMICGRALCAILDREAAEAALDAAEEEQELQFDAGKLLVSGLQDLMSDLLTDHQQVSVPPEPELEPEPKPAPPKPVLEQEPEGPPVYAVGDCVYVFSRSADQWHSGEVLEIDEDENEGKVRYTMGAAGLGEKVGEKYVDLSSVEEIRRTLPPQPPQPPLPTTKLKKSPESKEKPAQFRRSSKDELRLGEQEMETDFLFETEEDRSTDLSVAMGMIESTLPDTPRLEHYESMSGSFHPDMNPLPKFALYNIEKRPNRRRWRCCSRPR